MIIGKAIYAGGAGGMSPEIIVTAEAGSTLTCGAQSYTLGASETTHTFTVALGTYIVTATKGSDSATETVLVDMVAQYAVELPYFVPVSLTFTSSPTNPTTNYNYAIINGNTVLSGTFIVNSGDTVGLVVKGYSQVYKGYVKIDDEVVLENASNPAKTYWWRVPRNITSADVRMTRVNAGSNGYYGRITVTTS